ncbi:MAG: hypothetical protein JNM27_23200 [Leptospirales bacterium]|nr:hypothetical protein [Leptospirales bacterium]
MDDHLLIDVHQLNPETFRLGLSGDWSIDSSGVWTACLANLLPGKQTKIIINLSGVKYLDSTGLGQQVRLKGMVLELAFSEMTPGIRKVFLATSLHSVPFAEFANDEKAIRYLQALRSSPDATIDVESQIDAAYAFQKAGDHESALQVFFALDRRKLKLSPNLQSGIWAAMALSMEKCGYDNFRFWQRKAKRILEQNSK